MKGEIPVNFSFDDVSRELKEKRISYTGEEVSQPLQLTVEQIEKSLPPLGHGSSVPLAPLLRGRTKFLLEHPEECLILAGDRDTVPVSAKVHVARGQELEVFKLLEKRKVVKWIPADETYKDERGTYTNGLFGVLKPNKFTATGLPVLRVIMNLVPTSSLFSVIAGNVSLLPSATMWIPMVLSEGEHVTMSQGDMSNAFYLFSMPECWHRYMTFSYVTPGTNVGMKDDRLYRPACTALPMGWSSSVGLMQAISREVLLRQGLPPEKELRKTGPLPSWFTDSVNRAQPDKAWWQVYLDNFMSAHVGSEED